MNRLKELREDKDIKQKDIAKILGITQTGYSKYEVETNDIPTDVLKKLARYYNTSIDYLLYLRDKRKAYSKSIMDNEKTIFSAFFDRFYTKFQLFLDKFTHFSIIKSKKNRL